MGILRADRVSGLGGANAINGSVFFGGDLETNGNYLAVGDSDDFNFGSGDFTIECWVYADALSTNNFEGIIGQWPQNGANALNSWVLEVVGRDLEFYYCYDGANIGSVVQGATMSPKQWNHVMVTRSGNTMYMFHYGGLTGSGTSVTATFNDVSADVTIGGNINSTAMWNGNISNLRIIKGRALHTTASFTPPSTRLTKTSDTVLLCCQSPGDVTQEETGKIITPKRSNSNSSFPVASRRSPDKYDGIPYSVASNTSPLGTGEDHGTTFEDNTKFDTLSYMVPPGGTTAESNRGRAVFGLANAPSNVNNIEYVQIQSEGNAVDFGDLITAQTAGGAGSSSTRGIFGGGQISGKSNVISYVTIATTSNATDFGDLTSERDFVGGLSNSTRGLFLGGRIEPASANSDTVDYVTIASTGNAADFGNLQSIRHGGAGCASATRGLFGGGSPPNGGMNTIDYFTIASAGNGTDYGDLSVARVQPASLSSSTRGIWSGGTTPSHSDVIDYVTIASTGNATDFGNLTVARRGHGAASNSLRGIFNSGEGSPANVNTIDYVTIATTGNAADFGDSTLARLNPAGCSDSHGGIS